MNNTNNRTAKAIFPTIAKLMVFDIEIEARQNGARFVSPTLR